MRCFLKLKKVFSLVLVLFLAATLNLGVGCTSFSEDELKKLQEENEALAAELDMEKKEAEILNRALTSVYKERDRLVDLLNSSSPASVQSSQDNGEGDSEQPQQSARKVYQVKLGDTLSTIAKSHDTTVPILLRLNPFLMDRQNNMVWENDRIILP
jgi:septal ring factor EnvC (AmiA/AmiB activator)